MNIAACQVEDIRNDIPRALSIVASSVAGGEADGADLICFPEAFLQGYDVTADHVAEVAIDLSSAGFARVLRSLSGFRPTIVLGLIEREGDRFFNTAIAIARGRIVARYHKARLLESEQLIFTPGSCATVFDVAGVSVGLNICYDLNFPETVAASAERGASVIVAPCNNMLRRQNAELWKDRHSQIRCARARESALWIISSDVTGERDGRISYGPTAIIDPHGTVVEQVPLMMTGRVMVGLSPGSHMPSR